ncbi:complement receptor type 1-like [Mugil cephalus]|uniref:complement receptor type 1-like n=1 Tax=Mugil cephalus TaxID=48193 RepID=UPI001FB587BF|nr:complement receptor type 1-like [Mugil cephalus]
MASAVTSRHILRRISLTRVSTRTTIMKSIGRNILVLWFTLQASAQLQKDCPTPTEYPQTRLNNKYTSRQKYSSGEKVYYDCAEDFTPSKGSRAVQCKDGKWTKLTLKCEKQSCGNAGELLNGQFQYEGNTFVGEKVYAICNEGYTLKGLNYMTCKKSGWTGEFPTCEEGEATCSPPAVANAVQQAENVSVYQVGEEATFTCSRGFQLDGAQRIKCGPDGQWQPQPPRCLPSPDDTRQSSGRTTSPAGGCGVPLVARDSKARLADRYITKTSFSSGEKVYFTCDIGHAPAGGSRGRMCKNGKWTPLTLKCERKLCGSPGEILNGQFVYTGLEFGDTATAICDEGYTLVGKATRTCMNNGWDGRVPVCEAVVCEEPPEETNAERRGPEEPPYTYRSVLQYQCRVGTLVGQKQIWCTKDGTWSAPTPQCKEITCPPPNVANAFWTGAQNRVFEHRDVISIDCAWGYTLRGPSTLTCYEGLWSPGLPQCHPSPRSSWRRYY